MFNCFDDFKVEFVFNQFLFKAWKTERVNVPIRDVNDGDFSSSALAQSCLVSMFLCLYRVLFYSRFP